jgi:hypothetical protein
MVRFAHEVTVFILMLLPFSPLIAASYLLARWCYAPEPPTSDSQGARK